jgi:methionyl-tRNA formyltransferase
MYESNIKSIRVLFMGMQSPFSVPPLAALLKADIDVCGVIVPATSSDQSSSLSIMPLTPDPIRSPLPLVNPYLSQTVVQMAWEHGLDVFQVSRIAHPATQETIAELQPDVVCVACFPQRIPGTLLALPRYGFLNIHPSLLPAYRGPAPLFWIFRNGELSAGVTIHIMDETLDTGDIVAQSPVVFSDGICGVEAEQQCAAAGAQLLVQVVDGLRQGVLHRYPQQGMVSYAPLPGPKDFEISTDWSARRAFNFMRGTAEWGMPYQVTVDTQEFHLAQAISYDTYEKLELSGHQERDKILLQFSPGSLWARLA